MTYVARLPLLGGLAAIAGLLLSSCGRGAVTRTYAEQTAFAEDFSGFSLVDLSSGKTLASRNADLLFTPASNTKIFTLATCLAWLPSDTVPALAYRYDADTLRLWGLAYPALAIDHSAYNERIRRLIGAHDGPVDVSVHGYSALSRFGAGWMWDDYGGNWSPERSGLPVFGNGATVWRDTAGGWVAQPAFLAVRTSEVLPAGRLARDETSNRFSASAKTRHDDTLSAPLFGAQALAAQLLEDWTGRPVRYHAEPLPADWGSRVLNGAPRDSLLRAMMLPSDNFLAEQLLLCAGLSRHDETSDEIIRKRAAAEVLELPPGQLFWADASGLSHYNLVTPAATTALLRQLHATYGWDALNHLFARGGIDGTLRGDYAAEEGTPPYVWAKTGTLRHNHCLSGYVRTDSGKLLAFSFMNNHYGSSSATYKAAMAKVLTAVRRAY